MPKTMSLRFSSKRRGTITCYFNSCFCLDSVRPSQQFFNHVGMGLPGLNQYSMRIECLAKGHYAVPPVRLEPVIPQS